MKIGDLVRIRKRKIALPFKYGKKQHWEEYWVSGGVVVEEYNTWEKIVTVLYLGEVLRIHASDVQLMSRAKINE